MDIQTSLFALRDEEYAQFSSKLIPNIPPEKIIGVRSPALKAFAKALSEQEADLFISSIPHEYHEENMLHAILLGRIKDTDETLAALDEFLPHVYNWAVCDSIRPRCGKKEPERLLAAVRTWICSEHEYTQRFAIEMLMCYYLDASFSDEYPALVAGIQSDKYYVNMMIAWYFATALAKQWDSVVPYLSRRLLPPWVHGKTIQKAVESYRICAEKKAYLKSLRL